MTDYLKRELLPCPFCGGEPFMEPFDGYITVICKTCGADGPDGCVDDETAAFTWNRRALPSQSIPQEGEGELREASPSQGEFDVLFSACALVDGVSPLSELEAAVARYRMVPHGTAALSPQPTSESVAEKAPYGMCQKHNRPRLPQAGEAVMRHPFTKLVEARDHMALLDAAMWWREAVDEWGIQSAEAVPYAEVLRKAIDAYWNARAREAQAEPPPQQSEE